MPSRPKLSGRVFGKELVHNISIFLFSFGDWDSSRLYLKLASARAQVEELVALVEVLVAMPESKVSA